MKVRMFLEKDRYALQEVYLESRKQNFSWLDISQFLQGDFNRDTEGEKIWVALDADRPIGFISVWEPDNFCCVCSLVSWISDEPTEFIRKWIAAF